MWYADPMTDGDLFEVIRYPNGGEVWFRHGQPPHLVKYANGDRVYFGRDSKVYIVVAHDGRVHVHGMADALIKGKS